MVELLDLSTRKLLYCYSLSGRDQIEVFPRKCWNPQAATFLGSWNSMEFYGILRAEMDMGP